MKQLSLIFGVFAAVAIIGCSEATKPADSQTEQSTNGFRASGVDASYQGPVKLKETGEMLLGKPLTVVDFTAETAQPIDGLSSQGVSYSYTVGGVPSTSGIYGAFAAGTGDFYAAPMFQSFGNGVLTITFDQPTDIVEMALIASQTGDVTAGFTVEVYGPNDKLRGSFDVDLASSPFWSGAWFSYTKNAVKWVRITKNTNAAFEYAVDNITFHQGE